MLEAKARKPGYLYIYLINENPTTAEVYFDDLSIKHVKSPVIQYNDYYAYGLQTGNSWTRDNTKNNFLYNEGTELNPTSGLYDLAYRNFDPVLGRLTQVDPMADKYSSHSTYNYAFNDPITLNDPSGADPYQTTSSAKEYYTSVKNDMFGESWRDRGLVLDAGTRNGGSSFAKGGTGANWILHNAIFGEKNAQKAASLLWLSKTREVRDFSPGKFWFRDNADVNMTELEGAAAGNSTTKTQTMLWMDATFRYGDVPLSLVSCQFKIVGYNLFSFILAS